LATSFRIGPSPSGIYEGVANGGIGEIESLETSYVHDTKNLEAGATWRKRLEDTAFLYEGGTHAVDLNMWLANQAVIELQASVSRKKTRLEYRWDEDFAINLKYADGTVGRVWVNASAPLPRHGSEIAVYGATGAGRTARNIIMIRIKKVTQNGLLIRLM
jgi:predicted dehydrogenase